MGITRKTKQKLHRIGKSPFGAAAAKESQPGRKSTGGSVLSVSSQRGDRTARA